MTNQSQAVYANYVAAGPTATTTAETVIATTRSVSSPFAGSSFLVEFFGNLGIGAAATAATYKIRRDSLTGTTVLTSQPIGVSAGVRIVFAQGVVDSLVGDVAGQLWVLTVTMTAATGNSTATDIWTRVTTGV